MLGEGEEEMLRITHGARLGTAIEIPSAKIAS